MRVLGTRSSQKVAIMGSLTYLSRELTIHTSLTKPSRDFIAHLDVSFQQVVHSVRIGASRGDWSYHTSKLQERAK